MRLPSFRSVGFAQGVFLGTSTEAVFTQYNAKKPRHIRGYAAATRAESGQAKSRRVIGTYPGISRNRPIQPVTLG